MRFNLTTLPGYNSDLSLVDTRKMARAIVPAIYYDLREKINLGKNLTAVGETFLLSLPELLYTALGSGSNVMEYHVKVSSSKDASAEVTLDVFVCSSVIPEWIQSEKLGVLKPFAPVLAECEEPENLKMNALVKIQSLMDFVAPGPHNLCLFRTENSEGTPFLGISLESHVNPVDREAMKKHWGIIKANPHLLFLKALPMEAVSFFRSEDLSVFCRNGAVNLAYCESFAARSLRPHLIHSLTLMGYPDSISAGGEAIMALFPDLVATALAAGATRLELSVRSVKDVPEYGDVLAFYILDDRPFLDSRTCVGLKYPIRENKLFVRGEFDPEVQTLTSLLAALGPQAKGNGFLLFNYQDRAQDGTIASRGVALRLVCSPEAVSSMEINRRLSELAQSQFYIDLTALPGYSAKKGESDIDVMSYTLIEGPRLRSYFESMIKRGTNITAAGEAFFFALPELIKNALDAGATQLKLKLNSTEGQLTLKIFDNGKGISASMMKKYANGGDLIDYAEKIRLDVRSKGDLHSEKLGQKGMFGGANRGLVELQMMIAPEAKTGGMFLYNHPKTLRDPTEIGGACVLLITNLAPVSQAEMEARWVRLKKEGAHLYGGAGAGCSMTIAAGAGASAEPERASATLSLTPSSVTAVASVTPDSSASPMPIPSASPPASVVSPFYDGQRRQPVVFSQNLDTRYRVLATER